MHPQFVRYLVVGAANTGFNLVVYWTMLWLGLAVPWASLISLVIGIFINFTTHSVFVFANRDPRKLLPYLFVWPVLYVVNLGFIGALMHLGVGAPLAGLFSAPPTLLLANFMHRSLVFRA